MMRKNFFQASEWLFVWLHNEFTCFDRFPKTIFLSCVCFFLGRRLSALNQLAILYSESGKKLFF